MVSRVFRELQVEQQVLKEQKDRQGVLVPRVPKELKDQEDHKGLLVPQDLLE